MVTIIKRGDIVTLKRNPSLKVGSVGQVRGGSRFFNVSTVAMRSDIKSTNRRATAPKKFAKSKTRSKATKRDR